MKYLSHLAVQLLVGITLSWSQIIVEEVALSNDSIQLPGTLSYSSDVSSQPLVIFIQGSGNPDRNGNQLELGIKANYIQQLRDALNQEGIGFYSYDKRNVTKSNIPLFIDNYQFEMLAKDAEVAIDHFKNDKRFEAIVLLGHSQGSLVAMLASNEHVTKYISLAGTGEPVDRTIVKQITAQNTELGNITEAHFTELKATGGIANVNPMLQAVFAPTNLDFLSSYLKYDPVEEIKKLTLPVLIINGDKDLQVSVENAQKLHAASEDSEIVIVNNMNHVLKHIENDSNNQASYFSGDFPLSSELVAVLVAFIK